MLAKITKTSLLHQLPPRLRLSIIAECDLPDMFTLEVTPVEEKIDDIERFFPGMAERLTPLEWYMLGELYRRQERGATFTHLGRHIRQQDNTYYSNVAYRNAVTIHISHLRRKMKAAGQPWNINTKRQNVIWEGGYILVRKHHGH